MVHTTAPATLLVLVLANPSLAVVVLDEDFEDSTVGYVTSIAEFSTAGGSDYFGRVDSDGISIGGSFDYFDAGGATQRFEGFFAAQDIDGGPGGSQQTVLWSGLDITGLINLVFSAEFAEDDDGANEDWDVGDFLLVEYQIDGGGFQDLFGIENNGNTFNSAPFVDTDFDGDGDGAEITDEFALFNAAISGTGDSLDLRITIDLDSGDEDIAFDNVQINGVLAAIPEPTAFLFGALVSTGVAGLTVGRRRRRQAPGLPS